jgi:hypothetical protein
METPGRFFLLVFALSVPFALLGTTGLQLMPGIPVSALGFVCPATAAAILVFRESGAVGLRARFERSFDDRRIRSKLWYTPVLLLMPLVTILTYGLMRARGEAVAAVRVSNLDCLGMPGHAGDPSDHGLAL